MCLLQKKKKGPAAPAELITSSTRLHFRNLATSINPPTLRVLCIKAVAAGLKAGLVRPDEVAALSDESMGHEVPTSDDTPVRVIIKEMRVFLKQPTTKAPAVAAATATGSTASEAPTVAHAFVEFASRVHALACQRLLHHNPAYAHHTAGGSSMVRVDAGADCRRLARSLMHALSPSSCLPAVSVRPLCRHLAPRGRVCRRDRRAQGSA